MIRNLLTLTLALSFVSSLAAAALSPSDKQSIPYENRAASVNSGFENGISKWASSPAITLASATPQAGSKYAQWNSTSAAQTLTLGSIGRPEGQLEVSCAVRVPSGTATHTFSVVESSGSTTVASMSIENSTTWRYQTLIFPSPSAGTLSIVFTSVAADEPSIDIDDCYVGRARNVGSTQLISEWTSYTPIFVGLGTVTISEAFWRQEGDSIWLRGRATLGTTTGATATMSLPGALTISSTKATITTNYGTMQNNSATKDFQVLATGGNNTVSFSDSSSSGLASAIGTAVGSSGQAFGWTAGPIPIQGWTAQTTASIDAISKRGSIYFSTGSSATTTSGSAVTFNDAAFSTYTAEGQALAPTTANDIGIRMTGAPAGVYEVNLVGWLYAYRASGETGTNCAYDLYDGTTSRSSTVAGAPNVSGVSTLDGISALSGTFTLSSAGTINVVLRGQRTAGTGTCYAGGPVSISIKNVSQNSPAIVLANSVSTTVTNGVKILTAKVQAINGSTCTVSEEDGDWLGATTPIATGSCTVAVNAGVFSAAPKCTITGYATTYTGATQQVTGHLTGVSTSAITFQARYQAASGSVISDDSPMMLMCVGPR